MVILPGLLDKHARVHDVDLRGSEIADTDLSGLSADRLDLRQAKLERVALQNARLSNCHFENAIFTAAQCNGLVLRQCILDNINCAGTTFENARVEDCRAVNADFTEANFRNTQLSETVFSRACMKGAQLQNAQGEGVTFRGADLYGAKLTHAHFDDADFRGADLRGADLSQGCFRGADFRGALLDDAIFDDADLHGALFDVGAGPNAAQPAAGQQPSAAIDKAVSDLLLEGLSSVFSTHDKWLANANSYLPELVNWLRTASDSPPEARKQWAEYLISLTRGEPPPDIETLVNALLNGPLDWQSLLSLDGVTEKQIADQLRVLIQSLSSNSDQLPADIKPLINYLLEHLGANGFDSLKDVLTKLLQSKNQ